MTDKHLFVLAAAVSLCCLISLIWRPESKSTLWRYTMFGAFALYALTAMLAWLNQYTGPDLHPFYWFGGTTLAMMILVALNYFLALRAPVEVPDDVVKQLSQQTDSAMVIERYRQGMVLDRQRRLRSGMWVAISGAVLIGVAFVIIHTFGLAENLNGQQESLSKTLFRLVGEVHSVGVKLDTVARRVNYNGNRITALEKRNQHVDRRDSLYAAQSRLNQAKMLNNQSRALRILKPQAVPQPVQPIKPKRHWWEIGYHAGEDSLAVAKRYE